MQSAFPPLPSLSQKQIAHVLSFIFTLFFQSMKNVSCFKLNIDRSKAPKKMGTLKDISLFGSFAFPTDGEYTSGLVAQSLAGVGKMVKKTQVQVKKLASRESCLAGATGSSISSDLPQPLERQSDISIQPQDVYTIRFISHAPETVLAPTLDNVPRPSSFPSPPSGFALKKNSGKKTVFSLAQKEIMILFYNRQATGGMRADPKDVIACMRERGVEVLKEQQIRSWWSTYHQKRKRSLNALSNEACNPPSQQHPVQPPPVSAPTTPASQQPSTHAAPVSSATMPASQQPLAHTTPVSPATRPASQQPSAHTTPVSSATRPASQQPSANAGTASSATRPASQQPSANAAPVSSATRPASQQPSANAGPASSATTSASHQPLAHTTPVSSATRSASQQPSANAGPASSATRPASQQPSARAAPVSSATTPASQQPSAHAAPVLASFAPASQQLVYAAPVYTPTLQITGHIVPGIADITQWSFPVDFCQSMIEGRSGSNACTFIALYFGKCLLHEKLPTPLGFNLSIEWKSALYTAMKKGNEIHDEMFEGEGVDVAVEDAVNMAGTLCFVKSVGQGYDIFGHDCEDQLATVFEMLCTTQQSRCHAIVSSGRTMLLIVNEDGSCMIVDSHQHINHGAVIAYCPSNSSKMLAKWLRTMMQRTWQIDLRFCSVTPIFYVTP